MNREKIIKLLEKTTEIAFATAIFSLPFSIAALEIFLALSLSSWFAGKLLKGEVLCENRFLIIITGLFLICSSVSAFDSGYPIIAARGLIKIIKYALVMLVAFDLFRDTNRLKRFMLVGLISFSILVFDSLIQRFFGKDLIGGLEIHFTDEQIRLTGPYKFYGLLGAHLIAFFPLMIAFVQAGFAQKRDILKQSLWLGLLILSAYILYKTHSRGAWLASFASLIIYACMSKNKWLFGSLIIFVFLIPVLLPQNALIHLDVERQEQSLIERYHLWERAVQVIEKKPFFGCGINTFIQNYQKFDEAKNWRVPGYYAHNGYLQMAAETGLISLFLFLSLLGMGIQSGCRAFKKAEAPQKLLIAGFISGFAALLFQAAVDTTLHNLQPAVLIWLFLGILIALNPKRMTTQQ